MSYKEHCHSYPWGRKGSAAQSRPIRTVARKIAPFGDTLLYSITGKKWNCEKMCPFQGSHMFPSQEGKWNITIGVSSKPQDLHK
jgi:hypothetical protein